MWKHPRSSIRSVHKNESDFTLDDLSIENESDLT